jgi:pentatricopeptide repeat domain-containing protein 2
MDLWKELKAVGHIPMRRAVTFAAALALNQNAPHIAFEIISGIQQHNYVTVRNLKVHVTVTVCALYFPNQYKFKMYLKSLTSWQK